MKEIVQGKHARNSNFYSIETVNQSAKNLFSFSNVAWNSYSLSSKKYLIEEKKSIIVLNNIFVLFLAKEFK